jgi:hypothetical protein
MAQFLAPIINDQQEDANGDPLSGGTIEVYLAGTSTPAATTSDKDGLIPNTWPIVLNTLGVNNQGAVWVTGGSAYKFVIKNAAGVTQRTIDNVSGVNDTTIATDQWIVYQAVPTYVSATSFTVAGDQTQIFQARRRLKTTNTGGTIYSTVSSSAYGAPNTTVTVTNDSGVLDAGLSQVSYGIISSLNTSLPGGLLIGVQTFSASGTYTPTAGTNSIVIEMVGGGGGGGGTLATGAGQVSVGAGGSAGGYVIHRATSGFSGATVTIGAAGTAGSGANGGAGGTTSFNAITATGGFGGAAGTAAATSSSNAGAGGVGVGANVLIVQGQSGGSGVAAFAAGYVQGQVGGSGRLGASGISVVCGLGNSNPGPSATGRGGGGCGGVAGASQGATTGGAGGAGLVIVYEYA